MAKYWLVFGTGNPTSNSGLAPTLIRFVKFDGTTVSPAPGITEPLAGSGLYQFTYSPSFSIAFIADGNTTGLSTNSRYVVGSISPLDYLDTSLIDQGTTLIAIGNSAAVMGASLAVMGGSLVAIGNTLTATGSTINNIGLRIGTTASSFGATNADPGDLFGYLKRAQEFQEGNASYDKSSGAWSFFSRGSSTLLGVKALSQNTAGVTKI